MLFIGYEQASNQMLQLTLGEATTPQQAAEAMRNANFDPIVIAVVGLTDGQPKMTLVLKLGEDFH